MYDRGHTRQAGLPPIHPAAWARAAEMIVSALSQRSAFPIFEVVNRQITIAASQVSLTDTTISTASGSNTQRPQYQQALPRASSGTLSNHPVECQQRSRTVSNAKQCDMADCATSALIDEGDLPSWARCRTRSSRSDCQFDELEDSSDRLSEPSSATSATDKSQMSLSALAARSSGGIAGYIRPLPLRRPSPYTHRLKSSSYSKQLVRQKTAVPAKKLPVKSYGN